MSDRPRWASAGAALLAVVALALTGCTPTPAIDESDVIARPAALAGLPEVRLVAPGSHDVGASPIFDWETVDGAASYLLTLTDATGPLWSWQGEATSIRLGGHSAEPAPGATALRLREPGWWSVSAFSTTGELLAVSVARAVSPDDREPAPGTHGTAGAPTTSPEATVSDACELLTEDEVTAHLGGALAAEPVSSTERGGQYLGCEWQAAHDEFATLRIGITTGASKQSWDEDIETIREVRPDFSTGVAGLGDDAYINIGWNGISINALHESTRYSLSSGMSEDYQEEAIDLAVLMISRFGGQQP